MNIYNILNDIEKKDPEVYDRLDSRRDAMKKFANFSGKVALAAVPLALGGMLSKAYGQSSSSLILDTLNFALTLEYLEAEYYTKGLAANGLIGGSDRVAFTKIAIHEDNHVNFLRNTIHALGGKPVDKPTFDFTAHGTFPDPFMNYTVFLAIAQTFEDTGVRAYKGQAGNLISSHEVLRAALRIHSVEARHAAHVRQIRRKGGYANSDLQPWITLNQSGIDSSAVQASYAGEENTVQAGVQITGINGYVIDQNAASEAFDEPLTKDQVLMIVKPFLA